MKKGNKKPFFIFFLLLLVLPIVLADDDTVILPSKLIFAPVFSEFAHEQGTDNVNATGDYSITRAIFEIRPDPGEFYIVSRVIVQIQDSAIRFSERYGDVPGIINGIRVRTNTTLGLMNLTQAGHEIKSNVDWQRYCYDNTITAFTGDSVLNIRWTFSKSGSFILLNGSKGESMQIELSDDFDGLESHTFLFQGYILEDEQMEFLQAEQEGMSLEFFSLIVYLVFMGIILTLIIFMNIFKDQTGSAIVYGWMATTISILLGSMILSPNYTVIPGIIFFFELDWALAIVTFMIALYTAIASINIRKRNFPVEDKP